MGGAMGFKEHLQLFLMATPTLLLLVLILLMLTLPGQGA
jgi:hypothetical protein